MGHTLVSSVGMPLNSGQVQRAQRQWARLACRKARGLMAEIWPTAATITTTSKPSEHPRRTASTPNSPLNKFAKHSEAYWVLDFIALGMSAVVAIMESWPWVGVRSPEPRALKLPKATLEKELPKLWWSLGLQLPT